MPVKFRALLASYGGGHAEIIAPVARSLIAENIEVEIIGFTTAYQTFRRGGLPAQSVTALLEGDASEQHAYDMVAGLIPEANHPDVSQAETDAYFTLGFRDLAEQLGMERALEEVKTLGRKAFKPVASMERYLKKARPDIVITTTSPRFELALLQAARRQKIPSLAIGDLFLVTERAWILDAVYADHLAVLSHEVARGLVSDGFPANRVHVTGNPAFDKLAATKNLDRRKQLRSALNCDDKKVILFPAAGGMISGMGRSFLNIDYVVSQLEQFCTDNPDYSYIIREHPNRPVEIKIPMDIGILDRGEMLSAEDAISVSDVVCVENSTVGLQAALVGKPTICIGFGDQTQYPKYGLAAAVNSFDEALDILKEGIGKFDGSLSAPPVGTGAQNVLKLVNDILGSPDSENPSQPSSEHGVSSAGKSTERM